MTTNDPWATVLEKLDKIDNDVGTLTIAVRGLDSRMETVETRMLTMETEFKRLNAHVAALRSDVADLTALAAQRFPAPSAVGA